MNVVDDGDEKFAGAMQQESFLDEQAFAVMVAALELLPTRTAQGGGNETLVSLRRHPGYPRRERRGGYHKKATTRPIFDSLKSCPTDFQ